MASLHRDSRTGNWIVMFRWAGNQYRRSCKTDSSVDAKACEARIEDTIRLLEQGRLEIPADADAAVWIMSGGKIGIRHRANTSRLGDICDAYYQDQIDKAESTRVNEQVHIGHVKRVLGEQTALDRIDLNALQSYVSKRLSQKHRGKPIGGKPFARNSSPSARSGRGRDPANTRAVNVLCMTTDASGRSRFPSRKRMKVS